ncbi:830_t:CDS:2 [Racocetra persica]|uniref:830_t:CDS:1 n=1 Tax=Racocetra persica TaxID=160502 RepID=A0ACA9N4D0_9GLOM|nr:830_t:CDS:2 [Racocetra persica]
MSTGDKSAGSFFFMLEKFLEKFKNRLFIDIVLKDHDNSLEENITLKQAYSIAQIRKTYDKRDIIFGTLSMTKLSVPVECFSMEYPNLIRTACKLSLGRGDVSWLPLYGGPVANAANYCCIVDPLNARSCLADIKLDLNYTKVVEGELKEKDNVNLLRSVYKTFEESGSKNPGLMTARTLLAMHNNVPESVVEVIDEMVKPNDKRKTLINTNAKNYHEAYGLLSFSVNVICGFNNLPGETKYIILISVPIGEEIHTLLFISDTDALVSDNIIVLESLIVDTYGRRMWMLCTSDDSSTRKVAVGRRNEVKELVINNHNLEGTLKLENFPNLEELHCPDNKLITPERLEMLNISSNNVAESNLTPFSKFTNLKHLGLEELDLAGTDVDSGWEYLPESLQIFYLFAKEKPESKSSLIGEELKKYGEPGKDKDEDDDFALLLRKFKQVQTLQKFEEQETEIKYLELRIQELTNLIKNQKQKIINDFLNVLPEKGLIQQLITTYLELKKTEKQKLPSRKLEKECNKFKDELEDRLGEEFVEKMQFILSDCEELEKTQQNQIAEFEKLKQENLSLQLEELVRNQGRLIAEQVINKIEEINEDNEKMFSSTEEPIFDEKDKIGEGGHGVVYRGKHKKRDAAVKKLILTNDAKRQEIRNEINILKKLRDRNIIQYYGVYYRDKQILIIMDYAEGGSLKKLIDDNKNRGHD